MEGEEMKFMCPGCAYPGRFPDEDEDEVDNMTWLCENCNRRYHVQYLGEGE